MDISKNFFELHCVAADEKVVKKATLKRHNVVAFFSKLEPLKIGIEACGTSHHWARRLRELGHEVVLIPPQYVKAYVKRGKNDAIDAEAICEAMSRPSMRFVPVKSEEQQAVQMLVGLRSREVARRTQLANTIRGYAGEFGVIVPKGLSRIEALLKQVAERPQLPAMAHEMFEELARDFAATDIRIKRLTHRLLAWQRSNEQCRRLKEIPGVGPMNAALLTIKVPDIANFRSPRDFAAWNGLTPKNHSTAKKNRLGAITKAGDEALRSALVVGATSVINQVRRGRRKASPWLAKMLAKKAPKLVAVALANKMARVAYVLMATGQSFDRKRFEGMTAEA
jgi:transposase